MLSLFDASFVRSILEMFRLPSQSKCSRPTNDLIEASVYIDLLAQTQDLVETYPDVLPLSVSKVLKLCSQQAYELGFSAPGLEGEAGSSEKERYYPMPSRRSRRKVSKELLAFKSDVLALRQVVMESVTLHLLQGPDACNQRGFTSLELRDAQKSALGPEIAQRTSMDVTIWGGVHCSRSIWIGAHALLDTGSDANWISLERLSRADRNDGTNFIAQLQPIEHHQTHYVDFGGRSHVPTHKITLTWYWGARSQTRETEFLVSEGGPFDVLIGSELMGRMDLEGRIVLPIKGREYSAKERAQMDAVAAEKLAAADAVVAEKRAAEAAERRRKREAETGDAGASRSGNSR